MRQGQQNRRGRGRGGSNSNTGGGNNSGGNRKVQNPLSRTYESSGPDVKIRGTAAQIAEKYTTLSRDASSSSDTVMAENYLQHAEHYNRIIMAAQQQNAQNAQQNGVESGQGMNGSSRPHREANNGNLRDQPQPHINVQPGSEPQPVIPDGPEPVVEKRQIAERHVSENDPAEGGNAAEVEEKKVEAGAIDEGQAEQPKRRRRRYPAATNGAPRDAAAEETGSPKKAAAAANTPVEKRSSDETTTA
jgi:hypothetical protein